MAVLKAVTIKNFKSILDQTLDLGRLNVFVGTNGAGKSNLLEALGMLSLAASGSIDYQGMAIRGMRLSTPEVFRSAFRNKDRKNTFRLEGRFDAVTYVADISAKGGETEEDAWGFHAESLRNGTDYKNSLTGRSNLVATIKGVPGFDKSKVKRNQGIIPLANAFGLLPAEVEQAIKAIKDYAIFAPATPILRGVTPDTSMRGPLGLYGGGLAPTLFKWKTGDLNQALKTSLQLLEWVELFGISSPEPNLQSSHIHTGPMVVRFQDRFMPHNFKALYAYDVSEGALYVLFVLTLLLHPDTPPILALDNVDSALNPGMIRNLMHRMGEIIKAHPERQVFLTSHNPATLDGVDLFNPDHRLFVVKRHKTGGDTQFERIQPPAGMTRAEWGEHHGAMPLSELWLSGALGGITRPEGF